MDGGWPDGAAELAVVDIDGTLSDTRHRLHHIRGSRRDWDAFLDAAGDDPPHPEGLAVADELASRGLSIVYLSGRPERLSAVTRAWLRRHELPEGPILLRRDGDRRPATVVKLAALRRLAGESRIALLVDDDPRVVAAVRAAGPGLVTTVMLTTWQPRDAATDTAQHRHGRT